MADEKKMTQKEYFANIIKLLNGEDAEISADEAIEFVEGRIDVLSRKSGSRKPTKVQQENGTAKEKIAEALTEAGKPVTVTELIGLVDFSELPFDPTSQKLSALLKQMVEAGTVVKTTDKKKSLFAIA